MPFYNVLRVAGAVRGMKHTDDARLKMSLAKMGRRLSEEHKLRQSAALKGRTLSLEHVAKLKARVLSAATREKISAGNKGKVRSEDQRIQYRSNRLGKKIHRRREG